MRRIDARRHLQFVFIPNWGAPAITRFIRRDTSAISRMQQIAVPQPALVRDSVEMDAFSLSPACNPALGSIDFALHNMWQSRSARSIGTLMRNTEACSR